MCALHWLRRTKSPQKACELDLSCHFSPEAEAQLISIYEYIAGEGSPEAARRFTDAIADYCEGLSLLPHLGIKRDDLRPGMRIIGFRRRVSIAVVIGAFQVEIVGIFNGGLDFETSLTRDLYS